MFTLGLIVATPGALAALRQAGVGTLLTAPTAWTHPERLTQLRQLAELDA